MLRRAGVAPKFEDSPFGELVTDDSGAIFLDTDPTTFAWILGYLRRGCVLAGTPAQPLLDQVRADADYFGLVGLVAALDVKLEETSKPPMYQYDHKVIGLRDNDYPGEYKTTVKAVTPWQTRLARAARGHGRGRRLSRLPHREEGG